LVPVFYYIFFIIIYLSRLYICIMSFQKIFTLYVIFFIAIKINAASIKLEWNLNPPIEGVIKYIIYQSKNSEPFAVIQEVSGLTSQIIIQNLTNATYEYKIIAENRIGKSRPSASSIIKIKL